MDFKPYKIGKYLLLERLASGGMAEVYRAKASGAGGFEKELAVKLILPSYSNNEDFRKMFEYEARLSNKLTHANIVQIYDFVKPQDRYLLAMEFVDGKNLRQLVNKIKKNNYILPIELSVYLINEVCKGLEYAHSKKDNITGKPLNIIHRDMSPQNIMISYEGAVKIVDFGIAKAKDRVDETRSGVIKGKFGYMSPEQANGETVDHRSDIFSTGIILWELVTGRRLFATENDLATLKLIQECVIPVPSKINPKITQELEKILLKALTKDTRLRYQTAGALQRALQEYLNRHHSSFTSEEVSKVMHGVFLVEIQAEKKRFEAATRQSIPFSQGETREPGKDIEGVEEEPLDGEQTHSEIEVDTAVTFGEESKEISASEKSNPKSDSTIYKTTNNDANTVAKTRVVKDDLSVVTPGGKSLNADPEVRDMATKVANVLEDSSGESIKVEDTDVEQMPVLNQKTVVTSPDEGLLETADEEEDTTGEIPMTGSPIGSVRSLTPTLNQHNTNHTPSLQGPKMTNSGPSFAMEPVPQNRLELENAPIQDPQIPRSRNQPRRNEYYGTPKRRSSAVPFLLVFLSVGLTIYLYKILYSNEFMPVVTKIIQDRKVTEAPVKPIEQPPPVSSQVTAGECIVRIDSDPPGAEVLINNVKKGTTSLTSAVPCNKDINLEMRLKGHETRSANLFIKEKDGRVLWSMKKVPIGGVDLILSQNADVFLDGVQVGQAYANQSFKVEMRAGQKHRLRLKNETLGVDTVQEVTVQEGYVQRMVLRLDEGIARKPGSSKKK